MEEYILDETFRQLYLDRQHWEMEQDLAAYVARYVPLEERPGWLVDHLPKDEENQDEES